MHAEVNAEVTEKHVIEMLAQHRAVRPIFSALFGDSAFISQNPVSRFCQDMLAKLDLELPEREESDLRKFDELVCNYIRGIKEPAARQKLIRTLYDSFFTKAFEELAKDLGVVSTPEEVVDFMVRSTNDLLQQEFGLSLGTKGVHIIDPFTGTGTFIAHVLQSGLIAPHEMEHKYREEIHANEIVMLAYYIAALNIETTWQTVRNITHHEEFKGICLTDTFQMYEGKTDLAVRSQTENSKRQARQRDTDIQVILGNPPYQRSKEGNTGTTKLKYPDLDAQIQRQYRETSPKADKV